MPGMPEGGPVRSNARTVAPLVVLLLALALGTVGADTLVLEAARDATLIEDPDGALANGAGPAIYAGRTNQQERSIRRGLLFFDVASALPRPALIESVTLSLTLVPSNPGSTDIRVVRVLSDWGEGASYSEGGRGAPSEPGDATWLHTFYDQEFWEYAGGQFVGRESGRLNVEGPGSYALQGSIHLLQDVRLWAMAPGRNFGWMLIGDEARRGTVQAFASREHQDPGARPILTVTYRMPGERRPGEQGLVVATDSR